MNIRIRGVMNQPQGNGPSNGMYALQKALLARRLDWLTIGGDAQPGDLMWFWNWQDKGELLEWDAAGRPFVCGPNILFQNSLQACQHFGELEVLCSPNCRLLFTESAWYARLIEQYRRPPCTAPLILWPYPIDPQPEGPLEPIYDLLIYAKSGPGNLHTDLAHRFPRSILVHYGTYQREELHHLARRSRACIYLSDDDRGPLALAEILLCGCPAVGIERGAPWVENGKTGVRINRLEIADIEEAAMQLLDGCWSRDRVRELALAQFDPARVAEVVIAALEAARAARKAISSTPTHLH